MFLFSSGDTPANVYAEYLEYLPLSTTSLEDEDHEGTGGSSDFPTTVKGGVHHIALCWEIGKHFVKASPQRKERVWKACAEQGEDGLERETEVQQEEEKNGLISDRHLDPTVKRETHACASAQTSRKERRWWPNNEENLVDSREETSQALEEALDAARCTPTAYVVFCCVSSSR